MLQELEKINAIEAKWATTKILDPLKGWDRKALAVWLENQRIANEKIPDLDNTRTFKKIIFPVIRRIYGGTIIPKIVSIQPLLSDSCSCLKFIEISEKSEKCNFTFVDNTYKAKLKEIPKSGSAISFTQGDCSFGFDLLGLFTAKEGPIAGGINYLTGEITLVSNKKIEEPVDVKYTGEIPTYHLVINSETILPITKKMKSKPTFDVNYNRPGDALAVECEISYLLSQELALEMDREVLSDLIINASTKSEWDFNQAPGDTFKEKYESLYVKIVEVSNIIHRKTLRGGGNFIVTSSEIASIFETGCTNCYNDFTSSLGIQYVGAINNKWKLYKDPLFQPNKILVGYKGDSYLDSGYCFTPGSFSSDNTEIVSTHGKKFFDNNGKDFYAVIDVKNLVV